MSSISEMRKLVQEPRKAADTWYGRNVMRFFSIYLTWLAVRWKCTPNQATTFSLGLAVLSSAFFAFGFWGWGILFLNLWYLVDHVDGEIARLSGKSSLSGFFYDTIVNFFVQPLTLLGMGLGLAKGAGPIFYLGLLGAFGYLMMSLIPMCEDSILLATFRKRGFPNSEESPAQACSSETAKAGLLKKLFMYAHILVTFPNLLLVLTVSYLVTLFLRLIPFQAVALLILLLWTFLITVVWVSQVVHKIRSKKLDAYLKQPS